MKNFSFLLTLFFTQFIYAQKEANFWYFGNRAGLTFSSGSPVAITNANTNSVSIEGVASVSNSKGGLLFYTDGNYVFNKKHNTMTNGTGLQGNNSSSQSCVIVQQPVRGNRYYIFTTDEEWGSKGFCYSIVDTSLNGGNGQVITKNVSLLSKCAEKVSATAHSNKVDIWVASHSAGDNKFYVYKLSSLGIASQVVSAVGPTWDASNRGYSKGYLKFSPDGTKLVAAVSGFQNSSGQYQNNLGRIEIYDFNNNTGEVSNPQIIDNTNIPSGVGTISGVYGIEFSPNNRFVYASFYIPSSGPGNDGNDGIWQMDLYKKTAGAIGTTSTYITSSTGGNAAGGMQLGMDGKIYIARYNATFISSIDKPNCQGSNCNYVSSSISLSSRTCQYGLPNFISSFSNKSEFDWAKNPSELCEKSNTKFYVNDSTGVDSAIWNFSDASTGTKNKAKGFIVTHKFSSSNSFRIFLKLYRRSSSSNCDADTVSKIITIFSNPKPNLGRDTGVCDGQEVVLSVNFNNATYFWKDSSIVPAYIANKKGWHWVDVKVGGCTGRDSMYLDILNPSISLGRDTAICDGDSIKLNAVNGQKFMWSNGKTSSSIYVKDSGKVWVKTSNGNCSSSDTIHIKKIFILPDYVIDNPAQCYRNNLFKFSESTMYKGDTRKQSVWYFYDASTVNNIVAARSFPNPGTYTIKLISQSKLGCKDSISQTIKVFAQTQVDFFPNSVGQCLNSNKFDFYNVTKDTGKIEYKWDLGDKTYSTLKNIYGKVYVKDTVYSVKLVSRTVNNCLDSIIKNIEVYPNPKADFSWGPACSLSYVDFSYKGSKPINLTEWNFNNEGTSSVQNPKYAFKTVGTKKVKLNVTTNNGCMDSISKTVDVKLQGKADFEVNDVCQSDSAIFINKSETSSTYKWNFGDGNTSTLENPKHLYKISRSETFNVTLVAMVKDGCKDSITKPITINELPNSDFSYTSSGRTLTFTPYQTGNQSYRWLFGDGDSALTFKATHYFKTNQSSYIVCLKVINAASCISETCKVIGEDATPYYEMKGFKIFPNPTTGNFAIEVDNPEKDISIEVYNLVGKMVKKVEKVEKITSVDLEVAAGIYLVNVKNGKMVYYQKVSIETKR